MDSFYSVSAAGVYRRWGRLALEIRYAPLPSCDHLWYSSAQVSLSIVDQFGNVENLVMKKVPRCFRTAPVLLVSVPLYLSLTCDGVLDAVVCVLLVQAQNLRRRLVRVLPA